MTWQAAVSVSIIANVIAVLVQRRYAQKSSAPPTFPPAVSYLFGVMPVGLIAGFFILPHTIHWSWWLGLLLVIQGVSMAITNWIGFIVARHFSIIQQLTIGRTTPILVIILGWTILGEKLNTPQILGASILLAAALIAIRAPLKNANQADRKIHLSYVALALFSSAALAIGLVTEKAIAGHMEVGGVFLVGWSAQTLAMVLLALKDARPETIRKFKGYEFRQSALMGMLFGLTGAFYVYAIVHADNISLVTAVLSVTLPLTILGAYLFLHERERNALMWLSLAISFVGLLVMALA